MRPQAAINDELVRTSDVLVGMFWTKLGTHTGVAESGTVEEIDQFVAAGKPAMLYFSRRPIDPNAINLRQQGSFKPSKRPPTRTPSRVGSLTSTIYGRLLCATC